MKYRILGKSGLRISEIGLGAMSIPVDDEKAGIGIIHRAIDLGINYIDTADLYDKGRNEVLIGNALKGKRESIVLATKVGNQWKEDGSGWQWNPTRSYILAAAEKSLQRLQTDYIDVYQLHGGTIEDPIDETIEAFELLMKQGKIRHYGISSIRPNVIREYVKRSNIVSVMMQYSLADRRPEEEVFDLLLKNDVGVLARGSLAQGLLVNKAARDYLGHSAVSLDSARKTILSLERKGLTAAQIAICYVLAGSISSAVVGVSKISQLDDIATAGDAGPLTSEELQQLRNALTAKVYDQHR